MPTWTNWLVMSAPATWLKSVSVWLCTSAEIHSFFLLYTKVKERNLFALTVLVVDRSIMPVLLHNALFLQGHPVDMPISLSLGSFFYSLYTNIRWLCSSIHIFIYCNTNDIWTVYQRAIEVTWCFVPGLGITIFTHAYVIHETIAIDEAFAWKTFKKQIWHVVILVYWMW